MFLFIIGNLYHNLYGEEKPAFPFTFVDVPDSISSLLAKEYGNANCNAEHNVHNMTVRNDVEFQPGIYVFNGMGPHFKHMIFIFKKRIYIFKQAIEYATVEGMLKELSECRDSLELSENEVSLYKKVINTAINDKKIFVEDTSNKKTEIRKPFSKDVLDGKWYVQIKCIKKRKKMCWERLYDCYLTLQQTNANLLSIKESTLKEETHSTVEQKDNLYKITNLYKSKSKLYMIICRKNKNHEYELFYLSKKHE